MQISKLSRPPYAHNWVRYVFPDRVRTTKELVRFATGVPTTTYSAASPIIRDRIVYGLDRRTALIAAMSKGRANSRGIVAEYVTAFYDYDEKRGYFGKPCFDEIVEPFRVGKGLVVPVKPLITIVENGLQVPIFTVGWANFPLTKWQMRLLATIFEDAVFSLTDFRKSPGEFLCFPKVGKGDASKRQPLVWRRGDFELLSKNELRECLDEFLLALEDAKIILEAALRKEKAEAPAAEETPLSETPLFDWR
ncbi:hypothetical protein [Mesorhizobium sp. CA7]|uniref:hypothetical protein n=1 Tax=Mesorhizobium sp. CA7 TaxID=588501 RepID=UPI001CC93A42|nr:hypothetical protein [Mesorhizobium sp. CA7]MBZ9812906.1 hypothetical protein [Mesorhizobium sp. CA7]